MTHHNLTVIYVDSFDNQASATHQAIRFDIAEGNLLLFDGRDVLVAAYAPGVWRSVS